MHDFCSDRCHFSTSVMILVDQHMHNLVPVVVSFPPAHLVSVAVQILYMHDFPLDWYQLDKRHGINRCYGASLMSIYWFVPLIGMRSIRPMSLVSVVVQT